MKRRRLRRFDALPILTLAIGIAAAMTVLGFTESALSGPLDCPAPLTCAAGELDHLPTATDDRALPRAAVESGFRTLVGLALALTVVLIALVGLNVGTAGLTSAAAKRPDAALRAAIGASPLRLLSERIAAAGRIALPAVVMGCALGILGRLLLEGSRPVGVPSWRPPAMLPAGFLAAAGALLLVLFGTLCWPAALSWSRALRSHLREGGRSTPGPLDSLVKDALAVTQAAASLVLLVSAGLLVSAFSRQGPDPRPELSSGPEPATLLIELELPPEGSGREAMSARAREYAGLLERVRVLAGVVDTSLASEGAWLGLGVTERVTTLCLECWLGLLPKVQTTGPARIHFVGAGYFDVAGVKILRGRGVQAEDDAGAEPVAVISEALALQFFPNGDPLGKELRLGRLDGPWFRVVGVVGDLQAQGLGSRSLPEPAVYLSVLQSPPAAVTLLARPSASSILHSTMLEEAVRTSIPGAGVRARGTLAEQRATYREPLRWFGWLFTALALAALVCACMGLYGLLSVQVRLRTREIGMRMAIGAEERRIVRMVTGRTLRLVALGVVAGLIPLAGVARLVQLRFRGVDPWDAALILSTAALLLAVALISSWRPAWHAARVDPAVALRAEG